MRQWMFGVVAVAVGLAATVGVATAVTRSTTWIDAGQTFLLGGGQPGRFTVDAVNTGPVDVVVSARPETGPEQVLDILEPGERLTHEFTAGQTAAFANAGDQRAEVRLVLNGRVSGLSMRYGQ